MYPKGNSGTTKSVTSVGWHETPYVDAYRGFNLWFKSKANSLKQQ
jgi:hypothetical protein